MAESERRWTFRPEEGRVRLDQFLSKQFPDESRSQIQVWIRSGQVQVNGSRTKTGWMLRPGDQISLQLATKPEELPRPEAIPLTVLFQDEYLAVIEKPAGIVCHAGAGVRSGTLVNALLHNLDRLEGGDPLRPGIVHRLDKQTSGLMVVAKSIQTHRALSKQFKDRLVKKVYLALVYGKPSPAKGTIELALGRDPKSRTKFSVRARRRRSAITHYQVQKEYGPFSLVRVQIETGRTHQIRVHLSHKGYPIVGDTLYGGNRSRGLNQGIWPEAVAKLGRVFLHAHELEFQHPETGERLAFTSPLPPELESFLGKL
jgi:23S rRNA pseudouridine1911/1915/1917 synthase